MTPVAADIPVTAFVLAAPETSASTRAAAATGAREAAASGSGIAVSTCHRVEVYVQPDAAEAIGASDAWSGANRLDGDGAVRHMISVAVGLESAVLGEDQVLHQLRAAVAAARERGTIAQPIDVLADQALRAGRLARSWRPTRSRSLADLAIGKVRGTAASLVGRRILVVGAGEMGRLAAMAAARAGASVTVASPTSGHASDVALAVGGVAVPYDPGPGSIPVDAVVIALSGPWRAAAPTLDALERCASVVDLSVPGALPAAVVRRLGDRFVDVDGLAWSPGDGRALDPADARYRRRLEELRDSTTRAVIRRVRSRHAPAVARALAQRVEQQRAEHLEALWSRLPGLSPDDRAAIEGMTAGFTDRLFQAPLAKLGSDADDRRVAAAQELFDL